MSIIQKIVDYTSGSGNIGLPDGFPVSGVKVYIKKIILIGGGGGGGGGSSGKYNKKKHDNSGSSGGGGGSGSVTAKDLNVEFKSGYKYSIGAGGTAGTGGVKPKDDNTGNAGTAGTAGSASTCQLDIIYTANRGNGGDGAGETSNSAFRPGAGGAGGAAVSGGTAGIKGADGIAGISQNGGAGGAGVAGGSTSYTDATYGNITGYGSGGKSGDGAPAGNGASAPNNAVNGTSGFLRIVFEYTLNDTILFDFFNASIPSNITATNTVYPTNPGVYSITNVGNTTTTQVTKNIQGGSNMYVYDFKGNSYIKLNYPVLTKYTRAVWFKTNGKTTNKYILYDEYSNIYINSSGTIDVKIGTTTISTNSSEHQSRWTHFCVVVNGDGTKIYINGILAQTSTATLQLPTLNGIYIGADSNGNSKFIGQMYGIFQSGYPASQDSIYYYLYRSTNFARPIPAYTSSDYVELLPTVTTKGDLPKTVALRSNPSVQFSLEYTNQAGITMKEDPAGSKTNGQSNIVYYIDQTNAATFIKFNIPLKASYSKMFWLYSSDAAKNKGDVLSSQNNRIGFNGTKFMNFSQNIFMSLNFQNSYISTKAQGSSWKHYAIVKNNATNKITVYINGIKSDEQKTISPLNDLDDMYIGSFDGVSKGYMGYIYGVRIYMYALDADNISDIYSSTKFVSAALEPTFSFEDAPPTNYTVTNNGNVATITDPFGSGKKVYEFNGTNYFQINMNTGQSTSENSTKSFWLYSKKLDYTSDVNLMSSANFSLNLLSDNQVYASFNSDPTKIQCPIHQGYTWTHYAVVSSSDTNLTTIYVNGLNTISYASSLNGVADTSNMIIGKGLVGYMYQIQYYNKEISETDVLNLYNNYQNNIGNKKITSFAVNFSDDISIRPPINTLANLITNTDKISKYRSYMFDDKTQKTYYISCSSEADATTVVTAAFNAFDGKDSTMWKSKSTSATVTKCINIADKTEVNIKGEWLQLDCPESVLMQYYTIQYSGNNDNPKKWTIVAADTISNITDLEKTQFDEDIQWEIIDKRDYSAYLNSMNAAKYKFNIAKLSKKYNSFRFIYESSFSNSFCLYNLFYYEVASPAPLRDTLPSGDTPFNFYNKYSEYINQAPNATDVKNVKLSTTTGVSEADCSKKCDDDANCVAFSHDVLNNACVAYSKVSGALTASTYTTYVKTEGYQKFTSISVGDTTSTGESKNVYECKIACDSDPNCVGYVMNDSGNQCWTRVNVTADTDATFKQDRNFYMKTNSLTSTSTDIANYTFDFNYIVQTELVMDVERNMPKEINGYQIAMNTTIISEDPMGSLNYVYEFKGNATDYIKINVPTPIVNTRAFWVYVSDDNILDLDDIDIYTSDNYRIFFTDKNVSIQINNRILVFKTSQPENKWMHYAISCDGMTTTFYVNGNIDTDSDGATSVYPNTYLTLPDISPIQFGNQSASSYPFTGFMYGMRMYPYALTASQIYTVFLNQLIRYFYYNKTVNIVSPLPRLGNGITIEGIASSKALNWSYVAMSRDMKYMFGVTTTDSGMNGMWYSYNSGLTWKELNNKLPTGVTACTISPLGRSVAVSTNTGVYKWEVSFTSSGTLDPMSYWARIEGTADIVFDSIKCTRDGKVLYATTNNGLIYISLNDGWATMKPLNAFPEKIVNLKVAISNNIETNQCKIVVCGGINDRSRIYLSNDTGTTWTPYLTQLTDFEYLANISCDISLDGKTIVFAGKFLYIITEGNSIIDMKYELNDTYGTHYTSVNISDDAKVILTTDVKNEIYLSLDRGNTWSEHYDANLATQLPINNIFLTGDGKGFIIAMDNKKLTLCKNVPIEVSTIAPTTKATIPAQKEAVPTSATTSAPTNKVTISSTTMPVITTAPTIARKAPQKIISGQNMPVSKRRDLIFNKMFDNKNKSTVYKSQKEGFSSGAMETAIDLPMPGLDKYKLEKDGDKWVFRDKCNLVKDIKEKLGLKKSTKTRPPVERDTKKFDLKAGNSVTFTLDEGNTFTRNFAADDHADEGDFKTDLANKNRISGNLFGILNLDTSLSQINDEPYEIHGDVLTYSCKKKHMYKECTVANENGQYKCVCTGNEKQGDGITAHTHCGHIDDIDDISNNVVDFDILLGKFNGIQIEGSGENDENAKHEYIRDPKTKDLVDLVADYYISLLYNKQKFEKLEEMKQISSNVSVYHKDMNMTYQSEITKVINLGVGILISIGILRGLSG